MNHVNSFLHYKEIELGLSPRTIEAYRSDLQKFCSWLSEQKGKSAIEASRQDVGEFMAAGLDAKLNPATMARRLATLREFFKHLQRDRLLKRDPTTTVESPKQWKRLHKAITESEMRELLAVAESTLTLRDRAILELAYGSAIRVDEIVTAKLTDLDLHQRVLSVFGKGSKTRLVPVSRPAASVLQAYLAVGRPLLARKKQYPFLFISSRGKLTRQRVWQIVRDAAQRAGLSKVSPHVLRHSAATHMLEGRADLRTIQIILGHADISTTQLYTKVTPEQLRAVLLRCHPRNDPKRHQMKLFKDEEEKKS